MHEYKIESFDGTKIAVNHFKAEARNAVIIVCHGFWMSKDAKPFLDLSKDLFRLYDVIAMDQRGHGSSDGVFSFSSKEHDDIKTVIDYSKARYKHIYLLGFSLGGASCVIEVARNKNVDRLLIVSSPISFDKIENRFLEKGALIPAVQKFGKHLFKLRLGSMFLKKTNPEDVIDKISHIPILIIQGGRDPIVFRRHAEILYKKAKEPKKLIIVEDGLHAEDLYRQNPEGFINICTSWLKEAPVIR